MRLLIGAHSPGVAMSDLLFGHAGRDLNLSSNDPLGSLVLQTMLFDRSQFIGFRSHQCWWYLAALGWVKV